MTHLKRLSLICRICFLLLPAWFSPAFSQGTTDAWTLQKCIDYAKENNISVQKVKLSVESARWSHTQSIADLFPTVNASLSHSFNFGLRFDQISGLLKNQQFQSTFIGASSQFTIFNGLSNYNRVGQTKYSYLAAQADFSQALDDLSLNITDLYMQLLFAQERTAILQQQVDVLQQQADRNAILLEAGMITSGDLLNIQSQLASQQIQLVNGQNTLASAKLALIQALNLGQTDITIEMPNLDSIPIVPLAEEESAQAIYTTAVGLRPSIMSAQYRFQANKKALAVNRGGYYPSLSLNTSVGSSFSELRKENPLDPNSPTVPFLEQMQNNTSQQLSFGINIPIFNGLLTRTQVQQAKIQMASARLDLLQQQQNLRNTIQQAYVDAQSAYYTYDANSKNLEALEAFFTYANDKLEVGAINSVEYADAAARYYNAQTELLISRFNYIFTTKVLDFYKGKPIELK